MTEHGNITSIEVAKKIDHTLLKPIATQPDFLKLCQEAKQHGFYSVCIPSSWISFAKTNLDKSEVKIASVIGFPFGYESSKIKLAEAHDCLAKGAHEIDVVFNLGYFLSNETNYVRQELEQIKKIAGSNIVKVIVESGLLSNEQIVLASQIVMDSGCDFIKTSTGFAPNGASLEAVKLMRKTAGSKLKIKASGGIKTWSQVDAYLTAGADRFGCSSSIQILSQMEC